jgi:hypothetical protein
LPITEVVVRTLSLLAAVLAVLVLGGAGTAVAEPPFRVADRVTDRAGVLDPAQTAQVRQAIDRLAAERGYDLFVVLVDSFDGLDGQEWADDAANRSQLGVQDVLLAVAVGDRAYGLSDGRGLPRVRQPGRRHPQPGRRAAAAHERLVRRGDRPGRRPAQRRRGAGRGARGRRGRRHRGRGVPAGAAPHGALPRSPRRARPRRPPSRRTSTPASAPRTWRTGPARR